MGVWRSVKFVATRRRACPKHEVSSLGTAAYRLAGTPAGIKCVTLWLMLEKSIGYESKKDHPHRLRLLLCRHRDARRPQSRGQAAGGGGLAGQAWGGRDLQL
ncbi:hypothetical protein D9M71_827750 [compost metagenome]